MTIQELREKRAKAWEAAKAFLDSHRNERGVLSAEEAAEHGRAAVLYTAAYLYEHREEADHHALALTLRSLLFGSRKEGF